LSSPQPFQRLIAVPQVIPAGLPAPTGIIPTVPIPSLRVGLFAVSSIYRDFSRLRNPAKGFDGPGVRGGDDDRVVLPNPHHIFKRQLASMFDFV
jgi:hypothetical protein